MFERNRVDNTLQQMTVPAEITLADGSVHKGKFVITAARSIFEVLNGDAKFLEFETYDGERTLTRQDDHCGDQSDDRCRQPVACERGCAMAISSTRYMELGLQQRARGTDIRARLFATCRRSITQTLFVSVALPAEVKDYLSAKARRLNAAYPRT